jgi:hypothetical protein
MGRLDEALEVLQRAVRLNEELDDVDAVSTSRRNTANVLVFQRRTDAAIDLDRAGGGSAGDLTHRTHTMRPITLSNLGAALATGNTSRTLYPASACRERVDEAQLPAMWKIAFWQTMTETLIALTEIPH